MSSENDTISDAETAALAALTAGADLTLDGPAAAYLPVGSVDVFGRAALIDEVTVNGVPAALANDAWTAEASLVQGLNVLEVVGTETDGVHRQVRGVLAGSFQQPTGLVAGALQLDLPVALLDQLVPLVAGAFDPSALTGDITSLNPVLVQGEMVVDADAVNLGAVDVAVVPVDGAFQVTVTVSDFEVPLTITDAPIDFDSGEMTADALVVTADVGVIAVNGDLQVALQSTSLSFDNFDLEVNNPLANLILDPADFEADVLATLEPLLQVELPALVQGLVADLDLSFETALMGHTVAIAPSFASVVVTPSGVAVGVDVELDVVDALAVGDGHLLQGAPSPASSTGALIQVSDDLANRALHELWAAGVLNVTVPVEPTDLTAFLLDVVGGVNGAGGSLALSPRLPPTLVETSNGTRLQMGEVELTIGTPGGSMGEEVLYTLNLDAAAGLSFEAEAAGMVLTDPVVSVVPRGLSADVPEAAEASEAVEAALTLGIGAVNDLLSFPLEGVVLPDFELSRDPSGLATRVELSADALGSLLTGALTETPEVPEEEPEVPVDVPETPEVPVEEPETPEVPVEEPETPEVPEEEPEAPEVPAEEPEEPEVPAEEPEEPEVPEEEPELPEAPPMPNGPLSGQPYEVSVPYAASVYDSDWAVDIDLHTGWVCRFDDVQSYGDDNVWYLNKHADLEVYGTGNVIYARDDADVELYSSGNTVIADDGADIDDYVGGNTIVYVDPLTFDLDDAPDDGC